METYLVLSREWNDESPFDHKFEKITLLPLWLPQTAQKQVLRREWWWEVWGWVTAGRRPLAGSWWSHPPCYSLACSSQMHSGLQHWGSWHGHTKQRGKDQFSLLLSCKMFIWGNVLKQCQTFFNKTAMSLSCQHIIKVTIRAIKSDIHVYNNRNDLLMLSKSNNCINR